MAIGRKVVGIVISAVSIGVVGWVCKKRGDRRYEKTMSIVKNVDMKGKSPEEDTEEPKSVETMEDEVNQAFAEMDISEEETMDTEEEPAKPEPIEEPLNVKSVDSDQIWKEKVEKAVNRKDFAECRRLFDRKYNPYPYEPSPASTFGDALNDGMITTEFYNLASEHYGRLWCYAGD